MKPEAAFIQPDLERRCLAVLLDDLPLRMNRSTDAEVTWAAIRDLIPSGLVPDTTDNAKLFGLGQSTKLFHDPAHHEIFAHCARKLDQGDACTIQTIAESLNAVDRLSAIGGKLQLEQIADYLISRGDAEHDWGRLVENWIARHAQAIANGVVQRLKAHDTDVRGVCAEIASELATIADDSKSDGPRSVGEIAIEVADELVSVASGEIRQSGLETPFDLINKASGGLHPGQLIILGARPSVGKSIVGQQFAVHQALDHGNRAAIVSLEMSARELQWRNIAARQGVPMRRMQHAQLSAVEAQAIRDDVAMWQNCPLLIDTRGHTSAALLASRTKALKAKYPDLRLLVVDYLQIISVPGKKNRTDEIGDITRTLKMLAQDLDLAIVCLSQLNRDGEKAGRKPRVHDLRDSGSIEQDADMILFLHREKENLEANPEMSMQKQRNGALFDWTPLNHKRGHFTFEEIPGVGSGDGNQPGTWQADYRQYAETGDDMPF